MEEAEDFINLGIVLDNDKVLMIRRKVKEKGKGDSVLEWAFPGGKQRFKETREECVKREVLDETGYDVDSIKQIAVKMHEQFPVAVVYHLCNLNSKKPTSKPKEPHEVAEIKWIEIKKIRDLITSDLDPNVAKELEI